MSERERIYNLLKETFLLLDDGDRRFFSQFGLTVSRFYALFHLREEPGMSVKNLSSRMLCDKSNATRIVKGLEELGFVTRQPHETEGRSCRIYLTEPGDVICQEVATAHKTYNDSRLDFLNQIEEHTFATGLEKLNQHLVQLLDK